MFRVGFGFDSHPFDENKRGLKLGGVFVEADFGLKGHSDADVLLHAITDAILGALSAPDIGELFPPSDPQWKDADSVIFLKEALKIMRENGYRIGNIDCTLVCEKPKISPLKEKIRKKLSQLLEIDEGRVNIKGKTPEGFCSLEGIAVYCVALLVKE
jgi:2-C-methyl-D-erythritol 2,4-cyclodiphosphate synthase